MFCNLKVHQGLEWLQCKGDLCGRGMRQGGARCSWFFLPVKTFLSVQSVHLFITHRSTSTVLYWSSKVTDSPPEDFTGSTQPYLCLDCSHLPSRAWAPNCVPGQGLWQDVRIWTSRCVARRLRDVSGFSLLLLVLCQTQPCMKRLVCCPRLCWLIAVVSVAGQA